jgi:hypothetical protein
MFMIRLIVSTNKYLKLKDLECRSVKHIPDFVKIGHS